MTEASASDDLLSTIKERGYWEFEVRPATFKDVRIERRTNLTPVVAKSRIRLRSWDFPHVPKNEDPIIAKEWAGYQTQFEHRLEAWRMYRSGQFVMFAGIPYDWRDHSGWWPPDKGWKAGAQLGVYDTVAELTEFVRFAAHLATTDAGDEQIYLRAKLVNIKGREVYMDLSTRWPLHEGRSAKIDSVEVERTVERDRLVARPDEVARHMAVELFEYFNWDNPEQLVADLQQDLLKGR